jgi:hypothetical protein
MNLRYAILHHTGVTAPHFDLMFETAPGAPLVTWRSPAWPITAPTAIERLPDHRPAYLTYEGPVGNDRGHVTRVAGGAAQVVHSDTAWTIATEAGVILRLARQPDDSWLATADGQTP